MTTLTILAQQLAAQVAALEAGTHPANWDPAVAELHRLADGRWFTPGRAEGDQPLSPIETLGVNQVVFPGQPERKPWVSVTLYAGGSTWGSRIAAEGNDYADVMARAARVIEALPLAADLQPLAAE